MIGIAAIGTYVPHTRIDNYNRMEQYNTNPFFLDTKIGFRFLARKEDKDETSDLCIRALRDLEDRMDLDVRSIDCLSVVTQNPDGAGLPHSSALIHKKLELPLNVATFDVSLGCSGYVYGLSILKSFMELNGWKKGLLFTADPYSKILDDQDRNTELLFGDAATCTLLSDDAVYDIRRSCFATDGSKADVIQVNPETGKFEMKGQAVFKFTLQKVPIQIEQCLQINQLNKEDIDLYLVHQGSRYIVDGLAEQLGLPQDKLPFTAADVGNSVSSTIPLSLQTLVDNPVAKRLLLSGFGVGLSWASTVLERRHTL